MLIQTMQTRRILFSLCLILALSLTACDSGGPEEEPLAQTSFSLQITGEGIDESLSGFAYFGEGTDPETGEEAFILFFSDTEDINQQQGSSGLSGIFGRRSGRPGSGTYIMADLEESNDIPQDAFVAWFSRSTGDASAVEMYVSKSGTLQITSSSADRIEGAFDVEGTAFRFANGEGRQIPVTITGDFDARSNASVFVPNFTF